MRLGASFVNENYWWRGARNRIGRGERDKTRAVIERCGLESGVEALGASESIFREKLLSCVL